MQLNKSLVFLSNKYIAIQSMSFLLAYYIYYFGFVIKHNVIETLIKKKEEVILVNNLY